MRAQVFASLDEEELLMVVSWLFNLETAVDRKAPFLEQ